MKKNNLKFWIFVLLISLYFIVFTSAMDVSVNYPQRILYGSNSSVTINISVPINQNLDFSNNITNAKNNSYTLFIKNQSFTFVNSSLFKIPLNTKSLGNNIFAVIITHSNYTTPNENNANDISNESNTTNYNQSNTTDLTNESNSANYNQSNTTASNESNFTNYKQSNATIYNQTFSYFVSKDWDDDGYNSTSLGGNDCNDTNPLIHPGQNETFNNYIDDDCNSNTSDIKSTIFVYQNVYKLNDKVKIKINSRADQDVVVEVVDLANNNVVFSQEYNGTFPQTVYIDEIKKAGNYSINVNQFGFLDEQARFEKRNDMNINIDYSPSEPINNQEVSFKSSVNNGYSPYSYLWSFGDGGTSTLNEPKHKYNQPGGYVVKLKVTDNAGNVKEVKNEITVYQLFNVYIVAKDNETKKPIKDVEVYIGNEVQKTLSNGKASFKIKSGDYDIQLINKRYEQKIESIKVEKSDSWTFFLNKTFYDDVKPEIKIISPRSNSELSDKDIVFSFQIKDASSCNCNLSISDDKKWWDKKGNVDKIMSEIENNITLNDMKEGSYFWKIDCVDSYGNSAESEVRSLQINRSESVQQKKEYKVLNDEVRNKADTLKQKIESISNTALKKEKSNIAVVSAIKWKESLDKANLDLSRISRDIFNLRYRTDLNDKQRLEYAKNLSRDVDEINASIISNIKVSGIKSMVYYPSKEEIKTAIVALFNSSMYNETDLNLKKITNYVSEIQNELTVTSFFAVIEITYLNGNKVSGSVIKRTILLNESNDNIKLLEFIPKDVAKTVKEISVLSGEYSVINDEPLLEFSKNDSSIVYFIRNNTNLKSLNKTFSFIFPVHLSRSFAPKVSGFSIKNVFSSSKNEAWFSIVFFVVFALVIYLLFSLGVLQKIFNPSSKKRKNIEKITSLINDAVNALNENRVDNAVLIFKEIELFYNELNEEESKSIYFELNSLADKINLAKIDSLFNNAIYLNENLKKSEAKKDYNKIVDYYNLLSDESKKEVFKRLNNLKGALNET